MREWVHLCPPKGSRLGPETSSDPVAASPGGGRGPPLSAPTVGGGGFRRQSSREAGLQKVLPICESPVAQPVGGAAAFPSRCYPPPTLPGSLNPDTRDTWTRPFSAGLGGALGTVGRSAAFLVGGRQMPAAPPSLVTKYPQTSPNDLQGDKVTPGGPPLELLAIFCPDELREQTSSSC